MALVAQAEREAISRRTKEALAAAKAHGVVLGMHAVEKTVEASVLLIFTRKWPG